MKLNEISDPFILELIKTFDVTGLHIYKKKKLVRIVGRPTQKKIENKRDYRLRWVRFYKREVENEKTNKKVVRNRR